MSKKTPLATVSIYRQLKPSVSAQRSQRCIITAEARVMKDPRLKHQFTMKAAGKAVGVSDSFVSHIENGRVDCPKYEALDKFLKVYGGISIKYFNELVREKKQEPDDLDVRLVLPAE